MAKTVKRMGYTYRVTKTGRVMRISKSGRSTEEVFGREASRVRNKAAGGSGG